MDYVLGITYDCSLRVPRDINRDLRIEE